MSTPEPPFSVGIEEEYLLVNRDSRDVDENPPQALLEECTRLGGGQLSPRFLRSQLEASTRPAHSVAEARADLARLRAILSEVAGRYGRAPIAASTHPFAKSTRQITTEHEQFFALAKEMQGAARRLMVCGMHVHVGIEDDDLRVDLMNQLSYFVPHLLALSCSSPFWEGERTGLMSFRMSLFSSLPRTGLPERFASFAELRRHLDMLIRNGVIEDAGKMWWDVRPNPHHPALEVRVMRRDALDTAAPGVRRARRVSSAWMSMPRRTILEPIRVGISLGRAQATLGWERSVSCLTSVVGTEGSRCTARASMVFSASGVGAGSGMVRSRRRS